MSAIGLVFAFLVRKRMIDMDNCTRESWGVSDAVIQKITGSATG